MAIAKLILEDGRLATAEIPDDENWKNVIVFCDRVFIRYEPRTLYTEMSSYKVRSLGLVDPTIKVEDFVNEK